MKRKMNRKGKVTFPGGCFAILCPLFLLAAAGCGGGGGSGPVEPPEVGTAYTLSGTVTPGEYMVTDGDVNDPYAAYEPNDEFYQAQELSTPVRVSGYVNRAGEGPDGRSYSQGDPEDMFVAELIGGTTISLYMAEDPATADLSLYLYDGEKNLVDASLTPGEAMDSLTAPKDGVYYIRVEATESASIYVLTAGDAGAQTARYPLLLSDDFVPGEAVVRFEEQAAASAVFALSENGGGISAMGLTTKKGASGRDRLLKRAGTEDTPSFFRRLGVQEGMSRSLSRGNIDASAAEKMETLWLVRALNRQPGVRYAEPNYIRRALATEPNDTFYGSQWHYPLINLPEAWDITTGDGDVVVAVVDSGVLSGHPDLDDQLVAGYDFVDDDTDPEDVEESFHGTHVAGTIAAESNNGQGVAGVAWHARIMPLRVLDETGEGSNLDILEAVKYAAGLANASGKIPSTPADIINLSLGGTSPSPIEREVYEEVRKKGIIIVAAAGSEGTDAKVYPAAYEGVVSVGAVTRDVQHASYSNFGVTIDVTAPGGDRNNGVLSTIGELDADSEVSYTYGELAGTSMATPHMSGVAALMKSLYPGLTPLEFDALLQGGLLTRDLGPPDWDEDFGYGLIDAYKAVQAAREAADAGELRPLLYVTPGRLDFSALGSLLYVTVTHVGGGSMRVTDFYVDAPWLSVTAEAGDVDANGLGKYTVEVFRDGLPDGIYTGTVTFETSEDPVVVWVRMEVGEVPRTLNGGFHYVLLVDPDTGDAVDAVGSGGEDGLYPYEFKELSYGDAYLIVAGTDPDNDGYVCGYGEACGRYPTVDDPMEIEVAGDRSGLDFMSDIDVPLVFGGSVRYSQTGFPVRREDVREVAK